MDWGVDSKQIYVELSKKEIKTLDRTESIFKQADTEIFEEVELYINWTEDVGWVEYTFEQSSRTQSNSKWKIYLSDTAIRGQDITLNFL